MSVIATDKGVIAPCLERRSVNRDEFTMLMLQNWGNFVHPVSFGLDTNK